jgi:S-adenosylmethionine uptake transporter
VAARAAWLMVGASLLFALMAVGVKLASAQYGAGEIVFYRSLVGLALMAALLRRQRLALATPVPGMHLRRGLSGVAALCLWFHALGHLPLATAMTLNYMSSVWIAVFLIGWAVWRGHGRGAAAGGIDGRPAAGGVAVRPAADAVDPRLLAAVAVGFAGVALVLRPTLAQDQLVHGLVALASGMLAALAYLQVGALGRRGEPESRVVFYFSLAGLVAGAALAAVSGGPSPHTAGGLALLLGIGVLATTAQWMMTRAYTVGSTLGVASLQYLGIVFSFVFGVLLFGDAITWPALAGSALIIAAGVAATAWRRPAPAAPAATTTAVTP